jgi:hypothetical protein
MYKVAQINNSRNSNSRGGLSTVDLLIAVGCVFCLYGKQIFQYKKELIITS